MTHGQAVEIVTAYAVDASIKDGTQPVALRQALEHIHEIDREHERDNRGSERAPSGRNLCASGGQEVWLGNPSG